MKIKIKINTNEHGEKYVEIPVDFKVKIWLDKDVEKLNMFQLNKLTNDLERIELGEEVLNNMRLDKVETEEDTVPEPEKLEIENGDETDKFWE